MRWCCFVAALLGWYGAACQASDAEFPYTAYINSSDVYVRSGPGRNYYPTDKLRKGERVEVYRHDPGGWYAIRPPQQSFSWVSTRNLDLQEDSLAVVNGQRVVARVGSTFSDVREVIQVRLDKGEKVEVLEAPSPDSPWCKIAPPAGEFRWVFAKYLNRGGSSEDLADEDAPASGIRPTNGSRGSDSLESEEELQKGLDRIDLELSIMVADEISAWSFEDLQRRTENILKEAQTSVDRGRAHTMLDKLVRFNDIKQRQEAIRPGPETAQGPIRKLSATEAQPEIDPRFDGVGRLSPVISQKTGGPQYALVDGSNAVVSFVTPAPGVNLRPYVDKMIGVNGQRGYMTDLQRQHINVQRVTVLETQHR